MRRRFALAVSAFAIVVLCAAIVPHRPLLVWNASASVPIGLYVTMPVQSLKRGDLVFAHLPPRAQTLAAERGYLPRGIPVLKYIAALHGDRICADGTHIAINGNMAAVRLARDGKNRHLPVWRGCRVLSRDQIFLLNRNAPHSFDGRYFGPILTQNIIGRLRPLWLR